MKYAIIVTKKGEQYGLVPALHITIDNKMIVNENELRLVDADIEDAAQLLGGELMEESEVINYMKKHKK
ncbi:hypothetical protein SAMN04487900_11020 [Prevotella communis]|uniref:Uncharacterized protein n=1 Tax=Prevotella communis TaxID=2913614 RepID=A0A1H0GXL5_9BACT|nr:hypothetical protein [Prevotella communis]SDO11542.1 hypothetical protein SAMN04487900_11020 [Prevotella communis]